ncbi:MAG: hypothetical protein ACRCXZ_03790, partial [Patescibacteria group bacterium]
MTLLEMRNIRAIVFDIDGTLAIPKQLNFYDDLEHLIEEYTIAALRISRNDFYKLKSYYNN